MLTIDVQQALIFSRERAILAIFADGATAERQFFIRREANLLDGPFGEMRAIAALSSFDCLANSLVIQQHERGYGKAEGSRPAKIICFATNRIRRVRGAGCKH